MDRKADHEHRNERLLLIRQNDKRVQRQDLALKGYKVKVKNGCRRYRLQPFDLITPVCIFSVPSRERGDRALPCRAPRKMPRSGCSRPYAKAHALRHILSAAPAGSRDMS